MAKMTSPTVLSLLELPPEGRDFRYSNETGEMTEGLRDLIAANPYQVEIDLRPLGNAFEITGKIDTTMDLSCSRCGRETKFPIHDVFRELILIEDERPRGGHSGHVGSDLLSEGPFCNYVSSPQFDMTGFVHEHIASNEPYIVECGLPDCEAHMRLAQVGPEASDMVPEARSPFAVLKDLKVR